MAVILKELPFTTEAIPSRFRTSPDPQEAITQLYADHPLAQLYPDAQPTFLHPEINRNVHQGLVAIAKALKQPGTVGIIEGCMAAGKTTLVERLVILFPSTQVFRHAYDANRFPGNTIVTQSHSDGRQTSVAAEVYTTVADLLDQIQFSNGALVIVDEFHFAQDAQTHLDQLVAQARQSGTRLIFAGLNFDFARRPWPNALTLKNHVDLFSVVLAARCSTEGCHSPALFTTRQVTLSDGRTRPAHTDEPIFQVGSVANDYSPACHLHHQVMQPADALLFDAGHNPD